MLTLLNNLKYLIGANTANNPANTNRVAANEDGSILERLEQIQEAINKGTGTALAANKSIVDALGFTGSTFVASGLGSFLPRCVVKTDGAVLSGNDAIFTISGGPVRAKIVGLVTTVLGGAANGRLKHTTTTPAATVDLNAGAVAIDTDAAGTFYYNLGATSVFTPSSGLGFALLDPVTVEETTFLLSPGTVQFNASTAQTGVIAWYMSYIPLSEAANVVAAA